MIVKMTKRATPEEVTAVENKLHEWGYKTGKMVGEETVSYTHLTLPTIYSV